MGSRPLRVRVTGLDQRVVAALAAGDIDLVDDDTEVDVVVVSAGADGAGDAATAGPSPARRIGGRPRATGDGTRVPGNELTARELEVLHHLGQGASNRQIAQGLYIADNTVKNHVRSILLKLDCRSRTEAVVTALRMGLLDL